MRLQVLLEHLARHRQGMAGRDQQFLEQRRHEIEA
jgi:hypothetical protein